MIIHINHSSIHRHLVQIKKRSVSSIRKMIKVRTRWKKKNQINKKKRIRDLPDLSNTTNKIVMNFLVPEGYVDAAEEFQKESGTDPAVDLSTIRDRMAVKKAVQSGNIEEAIEKINDLNPMIVDPNSQVLFHLKQQKLIELIRNGKVEEALDFAQEELAPLGEQNQSFLEELEITLVLLAFDDGSNCPVGELLDPSQRLKTATEVNAAVLKSQSLGKDPKLPCLLKMLVWAQNQRGEKAVYPGITELSDG